MAIAIETLSQTEQFRKYMDLLQDPGTFRQKLGLETTKFKIDRLKEALPPDLTPDQLATTILLNLQQDYGSMIVDLPAEFQARESEHAIHVGNTNQIGVHYTGEIQKGKGNVDFRIACISLHFRDIDGTQSMYLEDVQGELRESKYSCREVRRVFGKLNSYFGEDWRVGLLRQTLNYAYDQGMQVKGKVPGIFWYMGSSLAEYPFYSFCYVQTYLRVGIPLENIEFKPVSDDVQIKWGDAVNFLKTRDQEERLHLLTLAIDDYAKSYRRLRYEWLKEKTIDVFTFDANTEREGARVFAQYFS